MNLELLIGKTVDQILMAPNEEHMCFNCSDGSRIDFRTEADCCSETWYDGYITGGASAGSY